MMKHNLKLTAFLLILCIIPRTGEAQERNDTAAVLQKCIDLPDLKQFISDADNESKNHVVIMQHMISFPPDIIVTAGGREVDFMTKEQVYNSKPEAFFLFEEFNINNNAATVRFLFNYKYTPQTSYKIINVSTELFREGNSWRFGETKTEGR